MALNWGLSIILSILIALNLIAMIYLKLTELRSYLIDTALISGCMTFCALAYFTGSPAYFLGILLYGIRLTSTENVLKFVVLFGGMILGLLTENNFYTYSSTLLLTLYTVIRLVESIIEVTLWTVDSNNNVET